MASNEQRFYVKTEKHVGGLVSDSSGILGLYSETFNKWLIRMKSDGSVSYKGKSDSSSTSDYATKAGKSDNDGDGNNIVDTYLRKVDISDWAKQSTKPIYTSSEVGALASNGTAQKAIADENGDNIASTYVKSSYLSASYLPLSGGTLSGNLVIGVNTDTNAKVLYLSNVKHVGSIQINPNGSFGAYSHTHSKWVWNCNVGGVSFFNGLADKASKAANGVGLGLGAGMSLSFNAVYAGTITGSQKVLQFLIPSSRVLSDTPTCTALSIILRHADGGYPYARSGSGGGTYTPLADTSIWADGKTVRTGEIKSISCANKVDGVLVTVTFGYQLAKTSGSTTAVTNNVPVSVMATGTITFS